MIMHDQTDDLDKEENVRITFCLLPNSSMIILKKAEMDKALPYPRLSSEDDDHKEEQEKQEDDYYNDDKKEERIGLGGEAG
jgi:hypothetical protein